jgi:two-component system, OmpR family, sensor histidine kinase CreC
MRGLLRPVTLLYLFLIGICFGVGVFVHHRMIAFEDKTFQMREGYLNEVAGALSGVLSTTARNGELDPAIIAEGFKRYESLNIRGYYDSEIRGRGALRIVVTDRLGTVVYDSCENTVGQSYSANPEVAAALSGRYERRDVPDDDGFLTTFIAQPISSSAKIIGVVIASKSNRLLDPLVDEAKSGFVAVGLALGITVLFVVMALFLFFLRPLQLWFRYVQQFKKQQYPANPQLRRTSFGYLGAAIDHLYDSLSDRSYIENLVKKFVHELKTPISSIRCGGELLKNEIPESQRSEIINDIVLQSDRMNALVMRMLSLAALEKRDSLKELERFRLSELLDGLLDELHTQINTSVVIIDVDIPKDLMVYCDSLLLKSAVGNLILNAMEHSSVGTSVEISAIEHGGVIDIRVRDHGAGIPDYAMDRIFEPFYSLPKINGSTVGTGLGLPFVREVADLHYGNIAITNHKDGGVLAILSIRQ